MFSSLTLPFVRYAALMDVRGEGRPRSIGFGALGLRTMLTHLPLPRAFTASHAALLCAAIATCVSAGGAAHAQAITSQPVVQPLPSQDTQRLNRALVELAKNPRSLSALLEAGDAALSVGDLDAALGFFTRAREEDEESVKAILGLAKVYLQSGRPVAALPLFEEAEAEGASIKAVRSDKALALDMVGDQAAARRIIPGAGLDYARISAWRRR
ncbi:MAG: tetratricopeptide repeat protein, partial [Pseudomonadota bacterium]